MIFSNSYREPGLYFFSYNFTPKEKNHTIVMVPERGEPIEWSLLIQITQYYQFERLYVSVEGKGALNYNKLLSNNGIAEVYKALQNAPTSADVPSSAEAEVYMEKIMHGDYSISVGPKVWGQIVALQEDIKLPENTGMLNTDAIIAIINHLTDTAKSKKQFDLVEMNGYISLATTDYLKKKQGSIVLDRIKEMSDVLAAVLSASALTSIKINNIKYLTKLQAELLSQIKGRLFLNSMNEITDDILKILLSGNLNYLSLRGLRSISDSQQAIISQSNVFVSLKKEEEEGAFTEVSASYSNEEIENSVASDKKQFSALKKMLMTPDKEVIDAGLTLLSTFSDPFLYDKLLERLEIVHTESYSQLQIDNLYKGAKKDIPFIHYSITGILYHAGEDAQLAQKIKNSIKKLNIDIIDVAYLHAFSDLEELFLEDSTSKLTDLDDLDESLRLKKLILGACPELLSIEKLQVFPLEEVDFTNAKKIKSIACLKRKKDITGIKKLALQKFTELENLDGIEFYHALQEIGIGDCPKLKDVSALMQLPYLKRNSEGYGFSYLYLYKPDGLMALENKSLSLSVQQWSIPSLFGSVHTIMMSISAVAGMKNLDWLGNFPNLEELSINSAELTDIKGLHLLKNLKKLSIFSPVLTELSGVEKVKTLKSLKLYDCHVLKNLDLVEFIPILSDITIHSCKQLENVEGLFKNKNYRAMETKIAFYNLPMLNKLGDMKSFQMLEKISFSFSNFNDKFLDDLMSCRKNIIIETTTNEKVVSHKEDRFTHSVIFRKCKNFDLTNSGFLDIRLVECDIPDLNGFSGLKQLKKLVLADNKKQMNLNGLEGCSELEELEISQCDQLADISALKEIKSLKKIVFNKLPALKDTSAIVHLTELESLETNDCKAVEVKQRPLGKMTQEETKKYQQKLATHYKLDIKIDLPKEEKKKETIGSKEIQKQISKIKKFLKERDKEKIDIAITLLSALEDEMLIEELLEGISYQVRAFKTNRLFTGSGPAQIYLNYALLGVLQCADKFKKWESFNNSIEVLELNMFEHGYLNQFRNLKKLTLKELTQSSSQVQLSQLTDLELRFVNDYTNKKPVMSLEVIKDCLSLKNLLIKDVNLKGGLEGLSELRQLQNFELCYAQAAELNSFEPLRNAIGIKKIDMQCGFGNVPTPVKNLYGLETLKDLEILKLSGILLEDTNSLAGLANMKIIHFNKTALKHLTLPEQLQNLQELIVEVTPLESLSNAHFPDFVNKICFQSTGLKSFPVLNGLGKIGELNITNCKELTDLNGIEKIRSIKSGSPYGYKNFNLSGCENLADINGILHIDLPEHTFGFKKIPISIKKNKIRNLRLLNVDSLDGIGQFEELEFLNLSGTAITSIRELAKLKKLKILNLNKCEKLESLEGIEAFHHLEILVITKTTALKDIQSLNNMTFNTLYIADSLLKKADFPSHLQDCIDWQKAYH